MERKFENARIIEVCESFAATDITTFLQELGMFGAEDVEYCGSVKHYIFAHGDSEQIFSPLEIRFMERFNGIIVYESTFEKTDKDYVKCRLIALRFKGTLEEETCLALGIGKILDKGFDGFTVCVFFSTQRIYLGCNKFSNDNSTNFVLSQPIYKDEQLELLEDSLYYLDDKKGFLEYYSSFLQIVGSISNNSSVYSDYEKTRINYKRLDSACIAIEDRTKLTKLGREVYDRVENIDLFALQQDCNEYLSFIKTKEFNSLDVWFNAAEIEEYFEENHRNDSEKVMNAEDSNVDNALDAKIKLLDDPDQLMKMIRKGRYE